MVGTDCARDKGAIATQQMVDQVLIALVREVGFRLECRRASSYSSRAQLHSTILSNMW